MLPSILYLVAVIGSMLSQLPFLTGTTIGTLLKSLWMLPLAYLMIFNLKDIVKSKLGTYFILLLLFSFYCVLMTAIKGVEYAGSDLYNITLCFVISLVSYAFWKNYSSDKFLTSLATVLLCCSVILAYYVYNMSFLEYDILSKQYAYDSKNSMGQILFAALLIGNVILLRKGKYTKLVTIAISILIFWVILILKSRATFLSILFVIAYFSLSYKNKYVRRAIVALCIICALFLLLNPEAWNTFYNGIILAGRDVNDFDDISSGRIPMLRTCWTYFLENPLVGIGNYYMDCFPVVILAQYGIIGAPIVFGIVLYVYRQVKNPSGEVVHLLAFLLLLSFIINSFFEAQPPFGPGAKCFFVWMFFGFHLANRANLKIN